MFWTNQVQIEQSEVGRWQVGGLMKACSGVVRMESDMVTKRVYVGEKEMD